MRGSRTIFASLFQEEHTEVLETAPDRKGRSEALVAKRNELLICRYYYYIKIVGTQYHVTFTLLEKEFFLTERTMIDMLARNSGILKHLHSTKPTLKYFRDKYHWMSWP